MVYLKRPEIRVFMISGCLSSCLDHFYVWFSIMVSCEIWEKHTLMIYVFEKLTHACLSQISLEPILLTALSKRQFTKHAANLLFISFLYPYMVDPANINTNVQICGTRETIYLCTREMKACMYPHFYIFAFLLQILTK